MNNKIKEPSFQFNINPGYPVKGAQKTDHHPNSNESIFNKYQQDIISEIIQFNIQEAEDSFQSSLEKEKSLAYQNGIQAGLKQAQQQYQKQINQSLQTLQSIYNELSHFSERFIEDQEQTFLTLIMTLSKKVIDTELTINPEAVLNVVRNCLNLINEREEIKILVNQNDWSTVKENINYLNLRNELPKQIDIISSPQISQGGCRIEFKSGSVDADIDSQFEEVKRKLLKYAKTD